ncbi:MAG: peptidyl-prolyl cis-trans isomerase [Solirubrobacteraceae bacterium]
MLKKSSVLALGAFFVLALSLAACGGGVPGDSVAKVGDQTIKKSTFDHWMKIAAVASAGQQNPNATTAPKVSIPDAPDFKQCIAQKKATAGTPAKGQPEQTDAQYKAQCQQQYDSLKNEVVSFLVRATWLDQEAAKQGVKVADKDVQKSIDDIKKQQFPQAGAYEKFLLRSGLTNADVLFQQRSQLLQQKITAKVTKGKDQVSDAQIAAYYNQNKNRFAQPERRDLRIVLTKDAATAKKALNALKSGQSFAAVAKKYSIDTQSKSTGGKLPGVAKGQQEKAFDSAIFGAKLKQLTGPVKTQFGYYVFEVTKITPAKQQSLEQSKASIKQILSSTGSQKALQAFGKDYSKRYKAKTDCKKAYAVPDCKNGPKQTATTPAQGSSQGQGQTTTP